MSWNLIDLSFWCVCLVMVVAARQLRQDWWDWLLIGLYSHNAIWAYLRYRRERRERQSRIIDRAEEMVGVTDLPETIKKSAIKSLDEQRRSL